VVVSAANGEVHATQNHSENGAHHCQKDEFAIFQNEFVLIEMKAIKTRVNKQDNNMSLKDKRSLNLTTEIANLMTAFGFHIDISKHIPLCAVLITTAMLLE